MKIFVSRKVWDEIGERLLEHYSMDNFEIYDGEPPEVREEIFVSHFLGKSGILEVDGFMDYPTTATDMNNFKKIDKSSHDSRGKHTRRPYGKAPKKLRK